MMKNWNMRTNICSCSMAVHKSSFYRNFIISCVILSYGFVAHARHKSNSSPVSIESVPFVASLGAGAGRACAASVVHERFLLTAASCLVDEFGGLVNLSKAVVGTNEQTKGGQIYNIQTILAHENYSVHTGDFNIGLVKLTDRIVFGPNVGTIKVGKQEVGVGDWVSVVGWGSKAKASPGILHQVSVPVLNKEECQQGLLGRIILPRMLCAGVPGNDQGDCVGDEGGPVFSNKTLVAVVSPFSGCGALPGLYTRVSAVRQWVIDTIDHNND